MEYHTVTKNSIIKGEKMFTIQNMLNMNKRVYKTICRKLFL